MPTRIEWTDETWNPVTGCTKISPGCANCYAERMAKRLAGRFGYPEAPNHFDVTLHPNRLNKPLHWSKPRQVFVCSMGDLFHDQLDSLYLRDVFAVMNLCRRHRFLLLTKRPHIAEMTLTDEFAEQVKWASYGVQELVEPPDFQWPLPNVGLGTSIENQTRADERIPALLRTQAAFWFVSVEPMLGAIDLVHGCNNTHNLIEGMNFERLDAWGDKCQGLDWVICGAETGPGARPMEESWALHLRDQCSQAGVPFFFKRNSDGSRMLDGQIYEQWPKEATCTR